MMSRISYKCDKCGKEVDYGDWFPVEMDYHLCRGCLTIVMQTQTLLTDDQRKNAEAFLKGKSE